MNGPVMPPREVSRRSGTANARFKRTLGAATWGGISVATVFHFAVFALSPALSVASSSIDSPELVPVPPIKVDIPPPPEEIRRPALPKVVSDRPVDETPFPVPDWERVPDLPPPPPEGAERDEEFKTPYTVAPRIKDRRAAQRAVERLWPRLLKEAGVSGSVRVLAYIDQEGSVRRVKLDQGSGHAALDSAALLAVREFEFTPALNLDKRVAVWVSVPVSFGVR